MDNGFVLSISKAFWNFTRVITGFSPTARGGFFLVLLRICYQKQPGEEAFSVCSLGLSKSASFGYGSRFDLD